MLKRKFIFSIVIFLLLTLIPASVVLWRAGAQDNQITFDEPVTGTLIPDDRDLWRFEAFTGDVVSIEVEVTDGNLIPQISILDATGTLQARIQGSETVPTSGLTFRLTRLGEYRIAIEALGDTRGSYTLTVSQVESTESRIEKGIVQYNDPVVHQISDASAYHIWRFQGRSGDVINVTIRTLDGDLSPTLSLASPADVLLAVDDASNQRTTARVMAFTLPIDGTYGIAIGRTDEQTQGTYELTLSLRNSEFAVEVLEPEIVVPGRLVEASPAVRYQVEAVGSYLLDLELSEPHCLADVRIIENELNTAAHIVGEAPLLHPVQFRSNQDYMLEIATTHCADIDRVDFELLMIPLADNLSFQRLRNYDTVSEQADGQSDTWYFRAIAGDMMRLLVTNQSPQNVLPLVVRTPDGTRLYTADLYAEIDQILVLPEDGIYKVQIGPGSSAYQLRRELVGQNYHFFTDQVPVWQQTLDVVAPQQWRIAVESESPAIVLIEAPDGALKVVARSTRLQDPYLEQVTFTESGRYQVKVLSETPPVSVTVQELPFTGLLNGTQVKSILYEPLDTHRWQIPLLAGEIINLRLTGLTPGAVLPSLSILDHNGFELEPEFRITTGNTLELNNLTVSEDGLYLLWVTNSAEAEATTYTLEVDYLHSLTADESAFLNIAAPVPENFTTEPAQTDMRQPLAPSVTDVPGEGIFRNAERLAPPDSARGEIAINEWYEAWQFSALRGQTLSIMVTSVIGQSAPGITVFDASGRLLIERWEMEEPANQILFQAPQDNTYYVVVTAGQYGEQYLISVEPLTGIDETVPVMMDALPLPLGEQQIGDFETRSETDLYAFWAVEGDTLQITATQLSGNLSPSFSLTSPRDMLTVAADFDSAAGSSQSEGFRVRDTGLYVLAVTPGLDGREESYSRYSLLVAVIMGEQHDDGLLEGEVVGTVGFSAPEDTWIFHGTAGERVTLIAEPLEATGPSPLIITIADSRETPFMRQQTSLSVNRVVMRDVMLPRTGIYLVQVNGGSTRAGAYRLSMERDPSYFQPGDHAIIYGDTQAGVFTRENILDRWILAGNAGDVIAVALRPTGGDTPVIGFQIESADGTLIGTGIDNGDGMGARQDGIVLPATGLYSILAGVPDATFDGAAAYELSVELQNRTTAHSAGTLIEYGTTHTGTLYADDPVDIWLFEGTADDVVNIEITGDGILEPALALVPFNAAVDEGQAVPLATRTGVANRSARLVNFNLPETGAYAMIVTGVNSTTGRYTLSLVSSQHQGSADRLVSGETYESSLEQNMSNRWIFDGQAGDLIDIQLDPVRRSALAPQLTLLSPHGTILYQQSAAVGEPLALTAYTLPENGVYTLIIDSAAQSITKTTGRYQLGFQQLLAATSLSSPQPLDDGIGIGVLDQQNLSDSWRFTGEAGDVIRISGRQTSGNIDVSLTFYDPAGEIIAVSDDTNNGLDALLTMQLPESGIYRIEITRFGGARGITAGNYRLEVASIYRPPTLPITAASFISYGEEVVSTIESNQANTASSEQWYFVGAAGDIIDVTLQFPGNDRPLSLFITDGAGNRYRQAERFDDRAIINGFELPFSGVYSLLVQRPQDARSEAFYPYSLSVSLEAGAFELQQDERMLGFGDPVSAVFNEAESTHLWLYEGLAGETITLNLVRLQGQQTPDLLVFSPDGRILVSLSGNRDEKLLNSNVTLPMDGLYQIMIINSQDNPLVYYRLTLNTGVSVPTAGFLQRGVSQYGTLNHAIPEEIWLINGTTGTTLAARAGVVSGNLELALRLESPEGAVLAVGEHDPITEQIILAPVILAVDGEYKLVVSRQGGDLGETAGSYVIRINDDMILPESLFSRTLQPSELTPDSVYGATTAFYTFGASATVPISIGIDLIQGIGTPHLRILNQQGEEVLQADGVVENLQVAETGAYLLEVTHETPITYNLIYQPRSAEVRTNSDVREVRRLVNLEGVIGPDQPETLWMLTAEAGETLVFDVEQLGLFPVRLDLVLYDPSGQPVTGMIQADADSGAFQFGPVTVVEDGIYTLRVGAWLGKFPVNELRYVMRVNTASPDEIPDPAMVIFESLDELESAPTAAPPLGLTIGDVVTTTGALPQVWLFWGNQGETITADIASATTLSLTLFSPEGETLAANSAPLEQVLPESGFYTLTVDGEESAASYTLQLSSDQPRPLQAGILEMDSLQTAVLTTAVPYQQWNLGEHFTEIYQIKVKPLDIHDGLHLFLLDEQRRVLAVGEPQPDGSLTLSVLLNQENRYLVQVTSDRQPVTYQIQAASEIDRFSPVILQEGVSLHARLTHENTLDEWVYSGDVGQGITLQLQQIEGEGPLTVKIFAPGYLFLQKFEMMSTENSLETPPILLPITGNYIIQVSAAGEFEQPVVYRISLEAVANP